MKLSKREAARLNLPVPPRGKKGKPSKFMQSASVSQKEINFDDGKKDRLFDELCKAHGLPLPVHEYVFHEQRKWRFDFLFEGWLALEVEGGAWTRGRHTRGKGFLADIEKYNEAAILGYTVIRCTPEDIQSGAAFALVRRALRSEEDQA